MSYISVDRYRAQAFGHDLDSFEDAALAQVLSRASAMVDTYCSVPTLPQPYLFSGGGVTNEQHTWTLGTDLIHGTRRVYPTHRPIKTVSQFRIRVTNQLSVTISGNDMFVNNQDGYVELVSLAAVSYGIYPVGIVPNLGLVVPVAELSYTYGTDFPVVGETLYATDGRLFRALGNFWATDPSPVIYVGGVATASGCTIDYDDGSVMFDETPTGAVKADYTYHLPVPIAQATGDIATDIIAELDLTSKGMRLLSGVQLAEMNIRRSLRGTQVQADLYANIPQVAQILLNPYRFQSVQ